MSAVFCQGSQVKALNSILGVTASGFVDGWVLKLYSNNVTPGLEDEAADYTAVSGGGYANINLNKANFITTPGNPSQSIYNAFQDFDFTGPTAGPGVVYGYFIVDGDGDLVCAERFPTVPITPINGSQIRIKPKITAASA